ncbi:MAG: 2-amino-4-hydroxy-6-hydroxymethyldihydropteridine diphosphokinase [Deltaproteobacteria bacterium]|nr:2-amino-4-hydroxy-6-hydroxymethyldihydropteridine diphosphokinase [Deltaproteobacteria bacterium]
MATVFLGVGANLGDRRGNCDRAVAILRAHPTIQVLEISPWLEYPAMTKSPEEVQPDYCNGVVKISSSLEPHSLLEICHEIERRLGRIRSDEERWQPRPIDLDILFYDDLVLATPVLTIPHPELAKRLFVLEPLSMIAPEWVHPVEKKSIKELCHAILH